MSERKSILIGLLVAVGLYSIVNAIQFASDLSENDTVELLQVLSAPGVKPALFAFATTNDGTFGNG